MDFVRTSAAPTPLPAKHGGSDASLPLELGHLPRGCARRACPRGCVDPGLAWPLASLRARPWHSTRSHPAAALALRTTTSCSRPRPSSVRQGRHHRRHHHLLNPTRMTRRQSCSGRCVCVCHPALPFDRCPPEPHARDSAVLVAAARARPRPRPNPTAPTLALAPALAPALAEALAGVRARVCGAAGGGGGGLGCDREGAQPRAPGEAGPPGRRDVLDGVSPALPSGLRVRWPA